MKGLMGTIFDGLRATVYLEIFKGTLKSLIPFLATEIPLKMMKNVFLFYLKSSFRSEDI